MERQMKNYFETSLILAKSLQANMDRSQYEYEFDSDPVAFYNYCMFGAKEIASDSDTKFVEYKEKE